MEEELKMYLDEARLNMDQSLHHLSSELSKIRAGRASASMLDGIMVDYYGSMMALTQVANIHVPDPRMLTIQPWEKAMIGPIEKAIQKANIGLNPQNNGELIRLSVPPLTEERRRDLVKQCKTEGETAKVAIRNIRREINEEIKRLKKDGLPEDVAKGAEGWVQNLTDQASKKVDEQVTAREKDIMTV
jgi:ribosome recycling factor